MRLIALRTMWAATHEYPYMHIKAHAAAGSLPKNKGGFQPEWLCSDQVLGAGGWEGTGVLGGLLTPRPP